MVSKEYIKVKIHKLNFIWKRSVSSILFLEIFIKQVNNNEEFNKTVCRYLSRIIVGLLEKEIKKLMGAVS
jgi:hypothetical protein